jgi:hypothetical protein
MAAQVTFIKYFDEKAVQKVSESVNYSMELESIIGARLNRLNCDNFVRFLKLIESPEDGFPKLITKHIEGPTMYNYFNGEEKFKTSSGCDELRSLVTRTLIGASIMNEQCNIVHNDLHQNNVIITSTSYDIEAYIFPDGEEYAFETFGKYPVIIDMDMAFTGPPTMLISTYTYRYGVCCHDSDPLTDARRLLSGLHPNTVMAAKDIYTLCMKNVFGHFNLTRCGWHREGVFPDVYAIIKRHVRKQQFNMRMDSTTIDLFTSHIRLPLKRIDPKPKGVSPRRFITKLSYADIKNILDGNDVKHLTTREFDIAKRHFTDIIELLNDIVYDEAMKFSNIMNDQIQKCQVKCVRDVIDLIYQPVMRYKEFQTVKIYNVEKCQNYDLTLTARNARQLNKKKMTLKELISL